MKRFRPRLTYANVVSTMALFLVVAGGSAFAANQLAKNSVGSKQIKKNAITTAKIKNGAVTGAKINASSLGTVPSAASAGSATNADNANSLGGTPASGYAKTGLEALHIVGAAGQPAFKNGCERYSSNFQEPAFYKDPFGVVHLLGDFDGCSENQEMFTLPAGFRPLEPERFAVRVGDEEMGTVRIEETGEVAIFEGTGGSLTDIQFRTN